MCQLEDYIHNRANFGARGGLSPLTTPDGGRYSIGKRYGESDGIYYLIAY